MGTGYGFPCRSEMRCLSPFLPTPGRYAPLSTLPRSTAVPSPARYLPPLRRTSLSTAESTGGRNHTMTATSLAQTPGAGGTKEAQAGLTWRALLIAILLTIACGLWVRQAEIMVISTQVSEAVPAIPALGALLFLLALNPLLRLVWRRAQLSRVEILTIYTFTAIAVSMAGVGVIRYWLASITYPFYFARPGNDLASLQRWIPTWMVPHNASVIEGLYMGAGPVPWGAWLIPLLAWTGFFASFWAAMLCLVALVRKRWMEEERLSFPVVELTLEMTEPGAGRAAKRPFFLNPVMWIGFSLTLLFNLINILHALYPSLPGLAWYWYAGPSGLGLPWSSFFPLAIYFTPLLIGFGFLVSTEISFSIWFFFLLYKLEGLLFASYGAAGRDLPYPQEQSIGAFLFLGIGLLWGARGTIRHAFLELVGRARAPADAAAPFPLRWALVGLMVSSAAAFLFCHLAGLAAWTAFAYLAILGLVALVCARIRAEAGLPLVWAFPFWMQKKILIYTFGTALLVQGGRPASLTMLALLAFLSRGYFPSLIGYQIDGLKTAEQVRMKSSHMAGVLMLALVFGLGVAYYFHLVPYYQYGVVHLRDGAMWGTDLAQGDFGEVLTATRIPLTPDAGRIAATVWGVVATGALAWLRPFLGSSPFHPLGFAVATAYGDLVWFPFLIVWVCKTLILRYGGIKLYRSAIPGFLGFALGHVFTAGVVWGLLGAAVPDLVSGYQVWFG